ncbi:MAG: aspartate-semialdehyde dehydrogenase, partial [Dehalococcoidia bacterium]
MEPIVAVIGATGAVGDVFLRVAEQREFPMKQLKLLASPRSAGKRLAFRGQQITVEETTERTLEGADIVFCSATSAVSKQWGPWLRARNAVMIDDGSAYRMDADVPLVVPEVNGDDLEWHRGIVSIPNCTTTPLVMALHAMRQVAPLRRVTAASYQAVTGTGAAAAAELQAQVEAIGRHEAVPAPTVYPVQIAMNVLPQVDDFDEADYTKEELKMRNETRKILHLDALPFAATCVRVPVVVSHSEAVHVEFTSAAPIPRIIDALRAQAGVVVSEDPKTYVTPLQAAGNDLVY